MFGTRTEEKQPKIKQTEELAPVSHVPVQASMVGQFQSTCLLVQNIKSFLNPSDKIHS